MNKILNVLIIALIGSMAYTCNEPTAPEETQTMNTYLEQHRPQFHFSPQEKWMNDPNGMVYYDGEYHLFYQYYPDSNVWGPMHWGHAISRDLVHWEHLPIALYPDSLGYIFSGSAVVDWNNTSGLGENGKPPLIAIFTHHDPEGERAGRQDFQYQSIAYSNDRGRSWTKYAGNPVLPNTEKIRDFRDPKVIWDERAQQWVMVFAAQNHVKFWASPDLISWAHLSDFGREWGSHGGVWECPDLFPIEVENAAETKWVLLLSINPGGPNGGSATQYFVGDFDGKNFTLEEAFATSVKEENAVWLDYGRDNYAGVTWSDIPREDGRRLFMGWMSNWDYATVVPTTVWRSAMTLPRKLSLHKTEEGYRLFSQPVRELEALRSATHELESIEIVDELDLSAQLAAAPLLLEMEMEFEPGATDPVDFGVELSNEKGESYRIGYDAEANHFYSGRTRAGDASFSEKFAAAVHTAPRLSTDEAIRLHLFFDVASAELFADGGATVLTDIFFPSEDFNQAKIFVNKGRVKLIRGETHPLKRIWQ
ncbi:MAG: glycoside hydrolase family 32 protein [Phaeodactylibacter sp.]|nr:glycoside hydrolase family 32 protein [Phaeodactylibacter sp.]MCB9050822.1 glycoside hydrolase family 32 protein [Lewinellaceae bacterium]